MQEMSRGGQGANVATRDVTLPKSLILQRSWKSGLKKIHIVVK